MPIIHCTHAPPNGSPATHDAVGRRVRSLRTAVFASCPTRVYPNALPVRSVMERLTEASTSTYHEFWPDDVSLLDATVADSGRIHGPRQVTDIYLLALAVRHGGQFVSFDTSVSIDAVRHARNEHLLIL